MAERKRVEEPKKELMTASKALLKDDCNIEIIDNDQQAAKTEMEALSSQREAKLTQSDHVDVTLKKLAMRYDLGRAVQWMKDCRQRTSRHIDLVPTPAPKTRDEICGADDSRQKLMKLLVKLPCLTATEDALIMKELRVLTSESPAVRALFGEFVWPSTKLLNSKSIQRSYSDTSLQGDLVSTILIVTQLNDDASSKIVQECTDEAMSFLIKCLRSQETKISRTAAAALTAMSFVDANRKIIGESGAIKPLIGLIEQGDPVALLDAGMAILNLCRVVENRERAVSEGAVIAVMNRIRSRVFVEDMLKCLEMLSKSEKAIEVMEEKGMLQCLFMILRDDFREKCKEYCMIIIHKMCEANVTKINEVDKGCKTLEDVVSSGTNKAREKANDLLSKLDDVAAMI